MSFLIVPNDAKTRLVKLTLGVTATYPLHINLFQNNYIPGPSTLQSNMVGASFSGYSGIVLSGLSVSATLDGSNRALASWSACTWTKSGPTGNTIYGYSVTDSAGNMLWVERFDSPIPMLSDGAYLVITPQFTGMSQFTNA